MAVGDQRRDCGQCGGVGQMIVERDTSTPQSHLRTRDCPRCNGTGYPKLGWLATRLGRVNGTTVLVAAGAAVALVAVAEIAFG